MGNPEMVAETVFRPAYQQLPEELAQALNSDLTQGLTSREAAQRLEKVGFNAIGHEKRKSPWTILLNQFKSPIVLLLLLAAGLSFFFGEWMDGSAILVVILLNALIGFYMEYQAGVSMNALQKLSSVPTKVIREGQTREIPSEEVIPGDVIFLEAGDMVTADARIFRNSQFQVDESALTGESLPVEKQSAALETSAQLAERNNMVFKGTFITKGNAYGMVSVTGMQTELGNIARLVQSADQAATPLEKKLEEFSKRLILITVGLVVLIFVAGLLNGQKLLEMLETSIALAVAAIPEGLPIVATMALAQGMLRMARHQVIVKKLSAVETLGGTNVICTDKTGTLTQNKIEVSLVATPAGDEHFPASVNQPFRAPNPNLDMIRRIAVLCNTASVQWKGSEVKETGDPLETGLLVFAHQTGLSIDDLRQASPKLREEPFSSETKIMATLHQTESGYFIFAKGSMEELLACCVSLLTPSGVQPLTDALRTEWLRKAEDLAAGGLRVLAGAYRPASPEESLLSNHLVFAGLIGMNDPPRPEVYQAIRECQSAGINLIMITGDHPFTARNIAQQLGIIPDTKSEVILGRDMQDYEHLSPAEKSRWAHSQVFARVSPQQKLDLVRVLQERRCVVGMTGDGVNDAPALKKADIGIAMGLRGTQVAQEVADMVLKDDSFSSIVLAIRQGRVIFENIRKFVIFLLSCNLSELLVIAIASMLNLHFQLFPLQILFINLITDVLPALALGVTEGGPDVMQQPPRAASEAIIDRQRWIAILFYSSVIGLASLGAVAISHYILHQSESWNAALCNNVLFYSLIFSQLLHVFNMGSGKSSFYRNEVFRNRFVWIALLTCGLILFGLYFLPPVRQVLSIHAMTGRDWLVSAGAGCFTLLFIQAAKRLQLIRQ